MGRQAALGEAIELAAQGLPGGGDHGGVVLPQHVAQHQGGALVPRQQPQGGQVGLEHEVAVPGLPRRHRVPVDGVHLDVHGEQVVAGLGGVADDLVQEVLSAAALALQAPLHVGHGYQDGVDPTVVDHRPQLVQREHAGPRGGEAQRSSRSAAEIAENSSSGALETRWCRL